MIQAKIYKVHRWAAVVAGICILIWLTSGIVMVLPPMSARPVPQPDTTPIDFSSVALSPAEALASLNGASGQEVGGATGIRLRRIGDTIVYEVSAPDGSVRFVDAASGQAFTITAEEAESLIRSRYPSLGRAQEIRLLTEWDQRLPWELPSSFKGVFENDSNAAYYVNPANGGVDRRDREDILKQIAYKVHVLEPIRLITGRERLQIIGLIAMSVLGLVVALSGYYIAVSRWLRRASPLEAMPTNQDPASPGLAGSGNS